MEIIADLHIHSKYSRATSKDLTIPNLSKWSRVKGANLLGTGDFTHPKWLSELKEQLNDDGTGFYKDETGFSYVLSGEISLMYSQGGRGRRVHLCLLAPNFSVVDQINEYLIKKGRVDYDGRPIFGSPCPELVENFMAISKDIEIIPAHIWTPWFGLLGSKTGFDSIKECFQEQEKHIHALETGLSSDPEMNWRLSSLDKYTLVSNSDSHSFWPWRIAREANIFSIEPTYKDLITALRTKKGMERTIEVDPGYGKYHYDGHRNCGIRMTPKESLKHKGICPVCRKEMTIGVLTRVEELADRPEGFIPKNSIPFSRLMPLSEIIAGVQKTGVESIKTWNLYNSLIQRFDSEINILLKTSKQELETVVDEKTVKAILDNRKGQIHVEAGYDGEYGYPVFSDEDVKIVAPIKHEKPKQKGLDEFC